MVAGYAYYGQNKVKFNPILLHENETDFLEDTVPHELAHLFSVELYGIMQGRGHGHNWKYVMQRLGVTPKRCHDYDTENARVKGKVKRVIEGHCSICSKTIMLTQKNVNMLWRYTSRCCKAPISVKPKVDPQQMKAIEIVKRAKEKGHNHNRMVLDIQLDLNVSRDIAIALCNIANDRIMNVS
jgi:predicted SprT family Zn-dependent metalloprotease